MSPVGTCSVYAHRHQLGSWESRPGMFGFRTFSDAFQESRVISRPTCGTLQPCLLRQIVDRAVHETLHQGHRPAFALQRLSDVVNLESNFLCHHILQQGFGMVSAACHGNGRHPSALAPVPPSLQTAGSVNRESHLCSISRTAAADPVRRVESGEAILMMRRLSCTAFQPVESHWRVMFAG